VKRYQDLKLFYAASGIRYPVNRKNPFAIIYFSENSTLLEDYPRLHILRQDVKYVMVPTTRIPRTRLVGEDKHDYKNIGLYAISDRQKLPTGHNIIIDLSKYLSTIDEKYHPLNYRQRAGMLLVSNVFKVLTMIPENYKKVFIYSVDTTKPVKKYISKKFFPFLQLIKDEKFTIDILYTQLNESAK